MEINVLLKKLFKLKKEVSTDISSYSGLVTIPTREQLDKYSEAINLLDELKSEYIHILSNKKIVLSKDLNVGDLRQDMNMYIELIMNLTNEEVSKSFENALYYNDGTKRLDYLTKMGKLKSYISSINRLEIETILRLVALKEILEEKTFLSPIKKNSIREELNNLSCTYVNLKFQDKAVKVEVDRFLTEYGLLDEQEFVSEDVDFELVRNKYKELKEMIRVLIPDGTFRYKNLDESVSSIILMEEELEKYIYYSKGEIKEFKEHLKDLTRYLKDDLELRKISNYILDLEIKLKAFALFERKLIKDEDIFNLYSLKFACLTRDYMKTEKDLVDGANYVELECYQEIILKKISDILTGKNAQFNALFERGKTREKAIDVFKDIMKENDSDYSFWGILNSKQLLGLLVSFDKFDGLKDYFNSIMVDMSNYSSVDFHFKILKFNSIIVPLDTVFSMIYYNEGDSFSPLYSLFYMMKEKEDNTIFRLPEGIVRVNIPDNEEKLSYSDKNFINKIRKIADYSFMKMPSTLEEINGSLFDRLNFADINLNEGLRKIGKDVFYGSSIEALYIPSSLEEIDGTAFLDASVDEFYFEDYKNSKLSFDSKVQMVKNFFASIRLRNNRVRRNHIQLLCEREKNKQITLKRGESDEFTDLELCDEKVTISDFKIYPLFSEMIFMDEDIPVIYIESDQLAFISERRVNSSYFKAKITDREVETVLKRIGDIILKSKDISDETKKKKKTLI